jgi:PAS domain S-box-containing protein
MRSSPTSRLAPFVPFLRPSKNDLWTGVSALTAKPSAGTKQALLEQTKLLQTVLDSLGDGLIVVDKAGKLLIWNAAAEKLVGAPPTTALSQWPESLGLYDPVECRAFPAEQFPMARALRGESCECEILVRTPLTAKSIWIEVTAHPLKDQNANVVGAVTVLRNITQRKISEQEIERLHAELESRVRQRTAQLEVANKELESFTYSVAHDLRAPLRHIVGFAQILEEDFRPRLEPEAQQYLTRIQQGTRRMGLLVDELLNLAKVGRQQLNLQLVGLTPIAEQVISELASSYEGREVEWRLGELPCAHCDANLVKQVFQHLISNAIKYTRLRQHAVIEVGKTSAGGQTAIFVRDNGVGFNMKYVGKLFGIFQRLHANENFEGTGVGLATVQRIVQKHHGRIWAEAEMDRGATFYFTLKGLEQQPGAQEST